MRNKIDYGIDLGTTNSAIARMQYGEPVIIKSESQKDTIPSVVHFTPKKLILVGDKAVNELKKDTKKALENFEKLNLNTFLEFKRTMGTTVTYYSSNMEKYFTSEELSAEVLKKLKSLVSDEDVDSVVITVPAKFLDQQIEATMRAARLAGFKQVHLLQEPVAAATFYGLKAKIKDGYLIVFDFGGGTFDAALLKCEEGIFSIKDTEGNNWLGGKDIDLAIVDKKIIPYLKENYAINSILEDPEKREILRDFLKYFAEKAKIELSFTEYCEITTELDDGLPFVDENGLSLSLEIPFSQRDLEQIASPIFQKAIDISLSLLERNHLKGTDLSAVILVGGPTYSPVLRKMIREQLTDKIDTSIDPMTIVAKGAALFASTISISDEIRDLKRDKTKIQLEIKYSSASVETDEFLNIKLLPEKMEGNITDNIFVEVVRIKPEGFFSGKTQISERPVRIDLKLEQNCPNEFQIFAYDSFGNRIECQPEKFSILQGIGGIDSMQVLPYHIGIVKYFPAEERDLFMPVKGLEKNKPIKSGITGVVNNLKTRSEVRPGVKDDIIRIPIYQGDYNAEGTNPDFNIHIKDIIISGETIPKFLPAGSPVNIRIKMNPSNMMTLIAEFPTIEHEEVVEIDIKNIEPPPKERLMAKLKHSIFLANQANKTDLVEKLEELKAEINRVGNSDDGMLRIMDEYRQILLELDKYEKLLTWKNTEEELKEAFYQFENLLELIKNNQFDDKLNMDRVIAHLEEYRKRVADVIREKNKKEARELIMEIVQLDFEIRNIVTGNAMDAKYLMYLNDNYNTFHWKNPTKARQLLNQGMQKIVNGETSDIRQILKELVSLIPEDERPETLQ